MILEQAGHSVITATSEPQVREGCAEKPIDVAVIGPAVSRPQKKRILNLVRELCPVAKVLELHAPHTGKELSEADDWMEVPAEIPPELAARVAELARK